MSKSCSSIREEKEGCWENTSGTVKCLTAVGALFAIAVTAVVVILIFKFQGPKTAIVPNVKPTEKIRSVTGRPDIIKQQNEIIFPGLTERTTTRKPAVYVMSGEDPYTVCSTPECKTAASTFLSAGNFSANPCDDFHEFVCGNYVKTAQIPDNVHDAGTVTELMLKRRKRLIALLDHPKVKTQMGAIDNARAFYQECTTRDKTDVESAANELKASLKDMGGMPLLTDTRYNSKITWQERLADFIRRFSAKVIIPVITSANQQKPTERVIHFVDPTFETRIEYLTNKEGKKKELGELYKRTIAKAVCILTSEKCKGKEREAVVKEIHNVIIFEKELMNIQPTNDFLESTVQQMEQDVPQLRISSFLKALYKGNLETEINGNTPLYVDSLTSLKMIADLMKNTDDRTVANYIGIRFLLHVMPHCPSVFRAYKDKYDLLEETILTIKSVEDVCVDAAVTYFPQTVTRLFVEKHLHPDAKTEISSLLEQLKKGMDALLQQNEWMDPTTQEAAIRKVKTMKTYSAYPEWILEDKKLNDDEGLLKPFDEKSVLHGIFALEQLRRKQDLDLSLPQNEWYQSPVSEKAVYVQPANVAEFYAGNMQPPVYTPKTIKAINYGSAGSLVGREIIHGFDDQGAKHDFEGKKVNWWGDETSKKFVEKQKCFVQQYSGIRDQRTNLKLDGKQTLGENIADSGGLRLAYEAYMMTSPYDDRLPGLEEYSHKQLFFIAYARQFCSVVRKNALSNRILRDSHAPDKYRSYIPPRNYDKFAEAFNCPPGTIMNPAERCVLW